MATVMVVDDTKVIRDVVARLLRREGFDAVTVSSGAEATEAMEAAAPDLVLLDVMMPEVDGLTWLQSVRTQPRWESLPVILMTAVSDDASYRRAEDFGRQSVPGEVAVFREPDDRTGPEVRRVSADGLRIPGPLGAGCKEWLPSTRFAR